MAQVTTRYEAQAWEPLFEGWRIARGRDVRLERTVILAAVPKGGMSPTRMDAWMARRSALVHDRVAVLLDFAETQEAYIAVFEGTGVSIGLPASEDTRLLGACIEIADGVEALALARVPFAFTGGQILWERGAPLLMGLPHSRAEQEALSEGEYVRDMSGYFSNVMEWQYLARRNNPGSGLIWEQAMRRLKGADGRGPETFVSLQTILQALQVDTDLEPAPLGPTPQPSLAERGTNPDRLPPGAPPESTANTIAKGRPVRRRALWVGGLALLLIAAAVYAGYEMYGVRRSDSAAGPATQAPGKNTGGVTTGNGDQGGHTPDSSRGSGAHPGTGSSTGSAPPSTALSSVIGRSPAAAVSVLAGRGVPVASIRWRTRTGTSGDVIAAARSGSSVILTVAAPKGEEMVPNLLGLTVSQASAAALAGEFHYSYVLKSDRHVKAGLVFAQSPGAYTYVAPGSNIQFSVAAHY